ncbi:hypothetical protein H1S06_09140 [Marinobacterium sp. 3-1745]|uniref:Uncharacterized protein n=2 Tax=Marinobacterium marinum TaxID=2756129 RepID=A0A7W1WYF1_9GAMM|nr:hypothetical protein [Marinobacterium marinum]
MTAELKMKNAKKRPFKWTRELVRLALNDSWTQTEIAKACRTQQSVVSAWSKGTKRGTEEQLKPLLNIYGSKLRRNAFRVYWSLNPENYEKQFFRVEGKVILSQAFFDPRRDQRGKLVKKIPMHKLVIHHQGEGKFRVAIQGRLTFRDSSQELECSVEDAIWNSQISEQMDVKSLLEFVDKYAETKLRDFPSDANTLPFLLRQALLNHGIPVDGVVEYPALW